MKIKLHIPNMNCSSCLSKIKQSLEELECEFELSPNYESKDLEINFQESVSKLSVKQLIEEAGFSVDKLQ